MRKAPSPRRRWRREVRSCLYDGKSSMRSPRLRAVLAAIHWGRCTRLALPHASSITREVTRCGCSISADVRIKSAAPPRRELCANAAKLQWLAPTLPELLRARHVDRSADARQLDFDAALLRGRRVSKKEQMRVSASFVLDRDRTARPANARSMARLRRGGVRRSLPAPRNVHDAASDDRHAPWRPAYPGSPASAQCARRSRPFGSGRCPARLPEPAGLAFRAAKLSINAENPGSGTTTR